MDGVLLLHQAQLCGTASPEYLRDPTLSVDTFRRRYLKTYFFCWILIYTGRLSALGTFWLHALYKFFIVIVPSFTRHSDQRCTPTPSSGVASNSAPLPFLLITPYGPSVPATSQGPSCKISLFPRGSGLPWPFGPTHCGVCGGGSYVSWHRDTNPHTHTHTYICHDKPVAVSAPPCHVVGADNSNNNNQGG